MLPESEEVQQERLLREQQELETDLALDELEHRAVQEMSTALEGMLKTMRRMRIAMHIALLLTVVVAVVILIEVGLAIASWLG